MSFNINDIKSMLSDYENVHRTGMDIELIASIIYDYTSGYPYLVSRICQLADERIASHEQDADEKKAWTKNGIVAVANRIFETQLYDTFLSEMAVNDRYNSRL